MGSIGRYIFRATFGAFLLVLISLTVAVWITQALRDFDLVTNQGQTILLFIGITSLIIPLVVLVITPIALVIAVAHILHKLSADSEIVVMNGAGMSPRRLLLPFLAVTAVVTLMLVAVSAYVAPQSLRMLREKIIEARADLLSNIVQPGRFSQIERNLAFHIRERRPNGLLVGILLDDRRDDKERVTILAEQGEIVKTERGSFLILEDGSIQRHEVKQRDPSIVRFQRYAFDLSQFATGPLVIKYTVRERYLWQLLWPDPNDPQFKEERAQFWAELHDRILGLLYPIAFVVIAYAFLGAPRTTRQSAAWPITAVVASVGALRLLGFVGTFLTIRYPPAAALQYLALAGAIGGALYSISRGSIIEPPEVLLRATDAAQTFFLRHFGAWVRPTS
jgi:lipopolysaccharide export system permease protein